jgi:hypothetical protein
MRNIKGLRPAVHPSAFFAMTDQASPIPPHHGTVVSAEAEMTASDSTKRITLKSFKSRQMAALEANDTITRI